MARPNLSAYIVPMFHNLTLTRLMLRLALIKASYLEGSLEVEALNDNRLWDKKG